MLRTRSPLNNECIATPVAPFDLHVLTTPPAFVLSQDQTLRKNEEFEFLPIRELRDSGINDSGSRLIAQHRFQRTEFSTGESSTQKALAIQASTHPRSPTPLPVPHTTRSPFRDRERKKVHA